MTEEESQKSNEAKKFIKKNPKLVIGKFVDEKVNIFVPEPVTLFMAGSPGAGKTEVSKRLIEIFPEKSPVRIDADEIRSIVPGYTGANSYIFQAAATKGVNILYDYVLHKGISAILDGTFAYPEVSKNIFRSLDRKREVKIYYIYQEPNVAWDLAKKREVVEHRYVSREVFINAFVMARENVNMVKKEFGDRIELNMIVKNFTIDTEQIFSDVQTVDENMPKVYNIAELERIIL
jgi:predicted kinase